MTVRLVRPFGRWHRGARLARGLVPLTAILLAPLTAAPTTLFSPSPSAGELFGTGVAVVGDKVVVGAPGTFNSPVVGTAYVYDVATGALLHTLASPAPAGVNDQFGFSVAAVGGLVAIGAPRDNSGASSAGRVYLFDASTGNLVQTIANPTPTSSELFGSSVAALGNQVIVGAAGAGANNAGEGYLFDTSGSLLQTFINPTPDRPAFAADQFGFSAAAVGDDIMFGAIGEDAAGPDAGAAYVYDADTGALLRTFLLPTPPTNAAHFGAAVAGILGDAAVGASQHQGSGINSGTTYVLDVATGALLHTLTSPVPGFDEFFGNALASDGSLLLVGSHDFPVGDNDFGAVYLFDGTAGTLLRTFSNPTPEFRDEFGFSVDLAGGIVVIGAPTDEEAGFVGGGVAYIFPVPEPAAALLVGLGLLAFGLRPPRRRPPTRAR